MNSDFSRRHLLGKMEALYQPQQNLHSQVVGLEALARIRSSNGQLITPDNFMSWMERNSLLPQLARTMCAEAIDMISYLTATDHADVGVSINVRPQRLVEPEFIAWLCDKLVATGTSYSRVTLEILEAPYQGDHRLLVSAVMRLRRIGIRCAIDDYGTGHSTVFRVETLEVNELKIARPLVDGVSGCRAQALRLEAACQLARRREMSIVLEGVETEEDLRWIIENLGEDLVIQGFLVSPPLCKVGAINWIASH